MVVQLKGPFYREACYHLTKLQLPWNSFCPLQCVLPLPPWFSYGRILNFHYLESEGSKNEGVVNTLIESVKFVEFCNLNYKEYVHIYTDGSYNQTSSSSSAALYIPEIDYVDSWHFSSEHNIVTVELYAIWQALLFVTNHLNNSKVVIFTDSLSSLHLIKNFNLSYRILTLKILESIVTIIG